MDETNWSSDIYSESFSWINIPRLRFLHFVTETIIVYELFTNLSENNKDDNGNRELKIIHRVSIMFTIYFLVFCSVKIDNGLISLALSCATLRVDLRIFIKPLTHNWTGVIFLSVLMGPLLWPEENILRCLLILGKNTKCNANM